MRERSPVSHPLDLAGGGPGTLVCGPRSTDTTVWNEVRTRLRSLLARVSLLDELYQDATGRARMEKGDLVAPGAGARLVVHQFDPRLPDTGQ